MYQGDLRRSRTPTANLWVNMTHLTNSHSWKFRHVRNLGIQASTTLCRMNREHNKGVAAFRATLYKMICDRCAQSFSNVFREWGHELYGTIDYLYSNYGSENLTQSESCANVWIFFMFKFFDPSSWMRYQQYIDLLEMNEVVQLAILIPPVFSHK